MDTSEDDGIILVELRKLADLTMSAFLGEPCRICGRPIQPEDIRELDGIRFAGRHEYGKQAAHARCWQGMIDTIRDAPPGAINRLLEE